MTTFGDGDQSATAKLVPGEVLAEISSADAAARAARAVPGVLRLQPGLKGLLRQFAAHTWERVTGRPVPDIAGVAAAFTADGRIDVDVRIVVSIHHHATTVGAEVHHAVTKAVGTVTDRPADVSVHIVEVDLEPGRHRPLTA